MSNVQIQNEQWNKIADFLGSHRKVYVGNPKECHRFVEAVSPCPPALVVQPENQLDRCGTRPGAYCARLVITLEAINWRASSAQSTT